MVLYIFESFSDLAGGADLRKGINEYIKKRGFGEVGQDKRRPSSAVAQDGSPKVDLNCNIRS